MNTDRVISYINGEMNTDEMQIFENDLRTDSSLLEEFNQYKSITESVKHYSRNELKDRLKMIEENNKNSKPSARILVQILLIIAILSTIAIYFYIKSDIKQLPEMNSLPVIDTIQTLPQIQDTSSINKSPEKDLPNHGTSQPIAADNGHNEEELFAAHFVPYSDEFMDGEVRGSDDLSAYEKFQKLYTEKKFDEAVQQFQLIDPTLKENDNVLFFYANALIKQKKYKDSEKILKTIVSNNNSRYLEHSKMLYQRISRFSL